MRPRRAARTHSQGKALTVDDIIEEGLGVLGLKPWELWEYDIDDFIMNRRGYFKESNRIMRMHYDHSRLQTYYLIVYDANISQSVRKKSIDKLIPHAYEPLPTPEDRAEWYEKQRAHAKALTEKLKGRLPRSPKKKDAQLSNRSQLHGKSG